MLDRSHLYMDVDESTMAVPAQTISFIADSHGDKIFGRFMLPALATEEEKAPVLVMLHGYPGLEQNMDMPPVLRRGGIATLYFNYRGVWGGHGYYSFSHLIEDTFTMVAWIKERAEKYHVDPDRIYLMGHSMGGFTALNALAQGVGVRGAVIMAPCDMAMRYEDQPERFEAMMETAAKGYFRMPHDNYLREDIAAHSKEWRFDALADKIPQTMPLRFIGGKKDTMVPPESHIMPLYNLLKERGMDVTYQELDAGHIFTAYRITLTNMVFDLVAEMDQKG